MKEHLSFKAPPRLGGLENKHTALEVSLSKHDSGRSFDASVDSRSL